MRFAKVIALSLAQWWALGPAAPVLAGECPGDYYPGPSDYYAPHRLGADELAPTLNADPISQGAVLSARLVGTDLQIDMLEFRGDVSAAASIASLFMIARLARPHYERFVLANEGEPIFVVPAAVAVDIGCRYLWNTDEQSENPIHLLRLFVDAMELADGRRAAPPFTGSLLGDTNLAAQFLADEVYAKWLLPALVLK